MSFINTLKYSACGFALFMSGAQARELIDMPADWKFQFEQEAETTVQVPHTWNALDSTTQANKNEEGAKSVNSSLYKRGKAVYRCELPFKPKPNKRYFVRGEGASIISETFVNGKNVGKHEGAFTAFCYEITDALQAEQNEISITVDNSYVEHVAPLRGDFNMFGGLYRPIQIIETDLICIDPAYYASPGVFIRTLELSDEVAKVEVKVRVDQSKKRDASFSIKATVRKLDGHDKKILSPSSITQEEWGYSLIFEIKEPRRWQGRQDPFLYEVKTTINSSEGNQLDCVTQKFGLRDIAIPEGEFFSLNGRPLQLRGVCRHQDYEGKGWAISKEDELLDMNLIYEMGANALRTGHYPASTYIYELCDSSGIVVWSEVPNVNQVRNCPKFIANNRLQAKEMILQHGNHPSICMWGIYNEIYHQADEGMKGTNQEEELTKLNKFVKSLDPSRPTVAATNQIGRHALNKIPDRVAMNAYPGWYGGGPETMKGFLDTLMSQYGSAAISEYGHGASIQHHQIPPKRPTHNGKFHPEEWQSHAHEINYDCIRQSKAWGTFIWNMFDFGSVCRTEGESNGINDKGLVTYNREHNKDAFYFYKANWNTAPMLHICSKRYTKRTTPHTPVKVYTNVNEAELWVNGISQGSKKPDELKRIEWEQIHLQKGSNKIEIKAFADDKELSDLCEWVLE